MDVITDSHPQTLSPSVATIGFFDGVHLGHRFLIRQVRDTAFRAGWASSVITFPVHPRQVIRSDYSPRLLSSPDEKIEALAATGIDRCILLPFTRELSLLSAREFMQLLRDKYNVRMLVIGYDHRFGHDRMESFEDYCRYGKELDIDIVRASAYTQEEDKVSSSAIRRALLSGDADTANRFLGRSYSLEGVVVDGYKVGRKIGFPTANLQPDFAYKLIPAIGVYAVCVHVNGQKYRGMLNIGHRPTLNNGDNLSIEVHILDFDDDIYQKRMRIEFLHFLRSEAKFRSVDELVAQMRKDKERILRMSD